MNIFKKIWIKIRGEKPLSCYDISKIIIDKIRQEGGTVGENVYILDSEIDMGQPFLIKIGDNTTITGAKILTHDASMAKKMGYIKVGTVEIGENVFISKDCIVLPGNKIGNNVIVGAGVVVAKDIPDNVVVVGNPWKVLCSYDEYIKKQSEAMKKVPVFESRSDLYDNKEKQKEILESRIAYTK